MSILTPCYNGENLIWRLLDSVLNQTYPKIEMIVIDDGSTDNSAKLIKSYTQKFEAKGYSLTYIYQKNLGLPGAINTGLRNISGEYLIWPDIDDWYNTDTAIADLVEAFENSPDSVGLVRGMQYLRDKETLKIIGRNGNENINYPKKLYEQCLFGGDDWWFTPGSNIIKTKHLFYYYPNKEIYWHGYFGQNIQLQFPILYDYDCITINKYIYNVLVDWNSDSRRQHEYAENLRRTESVKDMCLSVLDIVKNMPLAEREKFKRGIQNLYYERLFYTYLFNKKYKEAQNIFFSQNLRFKNKMIMGLIKRIVKKILSILKITK